MSWTHYTVRIDVRVSIHDEAEVLADNLFGEAVRRLTDVVANEIDLMQETKPDGVEIELA